MSLSTHTLAENTDMGSRTLAMCPHSNAVAWNTQILIRVSKHVHGYIRCKRRRSREKVSGEATKHRSCGGSQMGGSVEKLAESVKRIKCGWG